jgi:transposase
MKDKSIKKRKRIETFALVNPDAAGIDVSDKEHVVAVSPHICEDNVVTFGSFTCDLMAIAKWLQECGVKTVAMESTGVYWVQLFLLLQEHGFEVFLVNAKHVKNVTGRKDDDTDAAWLQKLHSCGLLNPSFQPDSLTRALRSTVRHRKGLIKDSSRFLNRVQKALELMNIKVHTVISDIAGKTGQDIINAIFHGERDAEKLASLADPRIKAPREEIVKSLEGQWRDEHLFELKQCFNIYLMLGEQIKECDQMIEAEITKIIAFKNEGEVPNIDTNVERKRSTAKTKASFNLTAYLTELHGIDITQIIGISELSALEILSECGTDINRWKTSKHFTSWLGLAPNTKISGGKVISSKVPKKKHNAGQAFRMAASTLYRSQSPLGDYFRRIKSRAGAGKAVVATARKIAVIYYHMIKNKSAFSPEAVNKANAKYKEDKIKRLERQLEKLRAA